MWGPIGVPVDTGEGGTTSGENTESESDSVPDTATGVGFWSGARHVSVSKHETYKGAPAPGIAGSRESARRGTVPLHVA